VSVNLGVQYSQLYLLASTYRSRSETLPPTNRTCPVTTHIMSPRKRNLFVPSTTFQTLLLAETIQLSTWLSLLTLQ